jgi:S-methylmethionine-dependent homocysteine/selenocysteine methylase
MAARARPEGQRPTLSERLAERTLLVIDGATGTELERRGAPMSLPLWSSLALVHTPELVVAVHADYVAAGADVITANTFRTQRRSLERGGWGDRAGELTRQAVSLAREAASGAGGGRPIWVLGSAPPLEDCYRPDLVPGDDALQREHAEHAAHLAAAGVDAIAVETMSCAREAAAATRAARETGLPVLVSFVCWNGARLLSGEPLREALDATLPESPAAVLVNCLPPSNVHACLPALRGTGLAFGVYPNLGAPGNPPDSARSEDCTPAVFAELAAGWRASGASLIGGCCGTTPAHIGAWVQRARN